MAFTITEIKRGHKTYYMFSFGGHTGYIKEAARRTPGVAYDGGSWMNGKAGSSNRIDLFLDTPSQELCEQFKANYQAVCKEKADARKAKQTPLKVTPHFQAMMDRLLPLQ